MRRITAIIPTLLKDRGVLNALIMSLASDSAVEEIIVINNSSEDYAFDNSKVRVISEGKNLFVNPSWNLGVREAKTEYVTLVNDDIKIPDGFCSKVLEKFDDKYGILGINSEDVVNTRNEKNEVVVDINSVELQASDEISFKPVKYRPPNFGIMMFFKKENYSEIPEKLKIFYGDDWILYQAGRKHKVNAVCTGQLVYHLGSLSSNHFTDVVKQEDEDYWKFIVPIYKRIFSIVDTYFHHKIFILGLKIAIKKRSKDIFANTEGSFNKELNDFKKCPIYIINFNRLTVLKRLVECLENKGFQNIHIVDNESTYPPLLDYYQRTKHKVHFLNKNYGHKAFWECGKFNDVINNEYYVVTDPDILPVEGCPSDFIELFYKLLIKNPQFTKVGFSLKCDDIPDCNNQKQFIVDWESKFYNKRCEHKCRFKGIDLSVYDAEIDTTFALYRPAFEPKNFGIAIRTGYPYQCIHLPWYKDSNQELSEEDRYYANSVLDGVSNYSINLSTQELEAKTSSNFSFWEHLFSITNEGSYKLIMIFGLKIHIKRRKINSSIN